MAAARASEALIRRALIAWQEATGREPGGVEVSPDGTVRVLASPGDSAAPSPKPRGRSCDDIFSEGASG